MDDLKRLRIVWQQAYIAGDVERLLALESETFTVSIGGKTMCRTERMQRLKGARSTGRWHAANTRFVDYDIDMQDEGDRVIVHVNTSVFEGDNLMQRVRADEVWRLTEHGWRIDALSYDVLPGEEQ